MVFSWLRRWRQRWPDLSHLSFIVYTRQGCHCCEDAWDLLQQWQRRCRFVMETVDVDTDPDLCARYGEQVPVVAVNGKIRFRGRVNEVLLKRLLQAEAARKEPKH